MVTTPSACLILDEFHITNPQVLTGAIASGDQFIANDEIARNLREALPGLQHIEMGGLPWPRWPMSTTPPVRCFARFLTKQTTVLPWTFPGLWRKSHYILHAGQCCACWS